MTPEFSGAVWNGGAKFERVPSLADPNVAFLRFPLNKSVYVVGWIMYKEPPY